VGGTLGGTLPARVLVLPVMEPTCDIRWEITCKPRERRHLGRHVAGEGVGVAGDGADDDDALVGAVLGGLLLDVLHQQVGQQEMAQVVGARADLEACKFRRSWSGLSSLSSRHTPGQRAVQARKPLCGTPLAS